MQGCARANVVLLLTLAFIGRSYAPINVNCLTEPALMCGTMEPRTIIVSPTPIRALPGEQVEVVIDSCDCGSVLTLIEVDWGDGDTEMTSSDIFTTDTFTHTYAMADTYTVTVTVTNVFGSGADSTTAFIPGPSPSPSASASPSPTVSASPSPSLSPSPTVSPSPSPSLSPSPTVSASPSPTVSASPSPSPSPMLVPLSPNTGNRLFMYIPHAFTYPLYPLLGAATVKVTFFDDVRTVSEPIYTGLPNTGSFSWAPHHVATTSQGRIRIESSVNSAAFEDLPVTVEVYANSR
eukprot:TRINITY_DN13873_c0_g1_i1.p1 TRINITY_DN13873_c0_g1~~TRINITY_DN13873_c0_g1_i1.p1  ORF type:complete len:292 (-),score=37.41 TRINITY_DN13873_c0_g1_i1:232-1107(-)